MREPVVVDVPPARGDEAEALVEGPSPTVRLVDLHREFALEFRRVEHETPSDAAAVRRRRDEKAADERFDQADEADDLAVQLRHDGSRLWQVDLANEPALACEHVLAQERMPDPGGPLPDIEARLPILRPVGT